MSKAKSARDENKMRKSFADLLLSICEHEVVSVSHIKPQNESTHFLVRITSAVTSKQRKQIPKVWYNIPVRIVVSNRVRKL